MSTTTNNLFQRSFTPILYDSIGACDAIVNGCKSPSDGFLRRLFTNNDVLQNYRRDAISFNHNRQFWFYIATKTGIHGTSNFFLNSITGLTNDIGITGCNFINSHEWYIQPRSAPLAN